VAKEFSKVLPPPEDKKIPHYLAGHWWSNTRFLGLSLLWRAVSSANQPEPSMAVTEARYIAPSWSWASRPETRHSLRREDVDYFNDDKDMDELYREVDSFRVVACRLELESSHALYGALRSGHMDVEAWVLRGEPLQRSKTSFRLLLDGANDGDRGKPDMAVITLLEIVSFQRSPYKRRAELPLWTFFPRGLVLSPNGDGTCRRVGLYSEDYSLDSANILRKLGTKEKLRLV
jgi:hypothetical protein